MAILNDSGGNSTLSVTAGFDAAGNRRITAAWTDDGSLTSADATAVNAAANAAGAAARQARVDSVVSILSQMTAAEKLQVKNAIG